MTDSPTSAFMQADDLDDVPDQGTKSAVRVRNYRTGFLPLHLVPDDEARVEILLLSQGLDLESLAAPSRTRTRALLGTGGSPIPSHPGPANTNDITECHPTETKRSWKLRKPTRSDLRRRTTTLAISGGLYEQGRRAFGNAWATGHDLDALVTLRPRIMDTLDPEQREEWWRAQLNKVRTMYAANENLPEFACLWSRESKRGGTDAEPVGIGEHMHLLLAAGGRHDLLDRYFRKQLKAEPEVDVKPADNMSRRLRNSQFADASTYLLKAVERQYWAAYPETPRRRSGPIYGQRVGFSKNLLDERPVGRRSRPRRTSA